MLLRWILKLIGLGFLLGVGTRCDVDSDAAKIQARKYRERAARRIHRLADRIAEAGEESEQEPGV